ncbi:hypothetical protein Moror_16248 [Moniliophthora roreri MCA 2997]|uniref:SWI5-dependent HO expression protein 3 n=2 Tax=Moniliophthora roreri TaxID=221103 RepID=V2XA26_MONRO|nr:hypothetical protein Moror_16248 [Moniliophthora roreri MCA 2997]KAI3597820.1 hypothetical protein WG66_012523 [Moniliophthora roreri]
MSSPGNPQASPQDRGLSPLRERSLSALSRPSSRSSVRSNRAPSPSFSYDDPVAVRNQISSLRHSIRQQQAQVHNLENVILRGPRPYADISFSDSMSTSTPASPSLSIAKLPRKSSFEVLSSIAGPDSGLPLPVSSNGLDDNGGIREGIPMTFGVGSTTPTHHKRPSSPTRTLSRIPVASVGNARALADAGSPGPPNQRSPSSSSKLSPLDADISISSSSSSALQPPPSPNRRISLTPGGTTKVLADLQAGVINARNALENTKAQLRLSQRTVAQLTRQTEDLKEGRERLRLENEGLNNVVARKERLLQEVLERARKAEAEAATLKGQLKTETASSKKSLREMESQLSESTALSQKCEREYITLRDSLKSMKESWKSDTDKLRDEMRKREERWKNEAEAMGKKYRLLVEEVKKSNESREALSKLKEEEKKVNKELEDSWKEEIEKMKAEVERSSKEQQEASETARHLAAELARLRRLMQRVPSTDDGTPSDSQTTS